MQCEYLGVSTSLELPSGQYLSSTDLKCVSVWKEKQYKAGRVLYLGSNAGSRAIRGATRCFYRFSKAVVGMLMKTLAMEWAPFGVRINVVSPGLTKYASSLMMQTEEQTGISDTLDQLFKDTPGILDALENSTMLNRTSDPSEQAVVVVYYLSDKSC